MVLFFNIMEGKGWKSLLNILLYYKDLLLFSPSLISGNNLALTYISNINVTVNKNVLSISLNIYIYIFLFIFLSFYYYFFLLTLLPQNQQVYVRDGALIYILLTFVYLFIPHRLISGSTRVPTSRRRSCCSAHGARSSRSTSTTWSTTCATTSARSRSSATSATTRA